MLHARAFQFTVAWTLGLLFLGSVVHATESSLACPDWPTCFGTMMPEMVGGVFWEHLHRLVAGGLVLIFTAATWLVFREVDDRPWLKKAGLAGVALLLVQSVFGGLTVIFRLPDLISTTHLALAFIFLSLATVLAAATSGSGTGRPDDPTTPNGGGIRGFGAGVGPRLQRHATVVAVLVFVQSVLGALVRHTDAGMACPDVPLCLGQVVPPLVNVQITSHVAHRFFALVATAAVLWLFGWVRRHEVPHRVARWVTAAVVLVIAQVGLGVASVLTTLAVPPVSLHTVVAAALLSSLVAVATLSHRATADTEAPREHATA